MVKNTRSIFMGLMSIIIFNSVKSMEDPRDLSENQAAEDTMERKKIHDDGLNLAEKNFKKRKRDNPDDVVSMDKSLEGSSHVIRYSPQYFKNEEEKFQEKVCDLGVEAQIALLAHLKRSCKRLKSALDLIENDNQDSGLLKLPAEVLTHIFEYCIALPMEFSPENLSSLVKSCGKNMFSISSACRQLLPYKINLNEEAKKYFNRALQIIVQKRIGHSGVSKKLFYGCSFRMCSQWFIHDWENHNMITLLAAEADYNMLFEIKTSSLSGDYHINYVPLKYLILVKALWSDSVASICAKKIDEMHAINIQDADGNTLLMKLIEEQRDRIGMISYRGFLVKSFCPRNYNLKNNNGDTVLILAAKFGDLFLVQMLLDIGVDVNIANNKGYTALMSLVDNCADTESGKVCLKVLCATGTRVDVNIQDNDGNTALMILSQRNSDKFKTLFRTIVSAGADLTIKNNKGKTVYDVAKRHRKQFIKKQIQNLKV